MFCTKNRLKNVDEIDNLFVVSEAPKKRSETPSLDFFQPISHLNILHKFSSFLIFVLAKVGQDEI